MTDTHRTDRGSGGSGSARVRRRRVQAAAPVLIAGLAATLAAGVAQAGGVRAAHTTSWRLAHTPNPPHAAISVLAGVACSSKRLCTAVGSSARTQSSPTRTLAERWTGSRWKLQHIPNPGSTSPVLYGVACPAKHACVAVGNAFHTRGHRTTVLIETWNGHRWRLRRARSVGGFSALQAVSCGSKASCTAVGFDHLAGGRSQVLAEHWNGKAWKRQTPRRPAGDSQLLGVSCPSAHACVAVGNVTPKRGSTRPLVESWNGRRWRIQSTRQPHGPRSGILDAVSCTSPRACTATGTDFDSGGLTLAERWNGRSWRVQRTPNPANSSSSFGAVELDGVSCSSSRSCTASGDYSPGAGADYFAESWNGKRWRLRGVPHPAHFIRGALLAVGCARGRCTAVGGYTGTGPLQQTLAMVS